MRKSTVIGAIHRHTNLKRDKMTSAPKLKTQHKIQRVEFVKNSTEWNVVRIFLFSLISCIMCTKPYIFLFLLYRLYLATKKINLDGLDGFKPYWKSEEGKTLFHQKKFQWWKCHGIMCFLQTWNSSTLLQFTKMNSDDFVSVIDTHILPFLRRFLRKKYTFQLDNATSHTSSSTSQWFSACSIKIARLLA